MRKILVTSALPYANGPIHLGHLVEYIQTDIWVRAMRAFGHQVSYVCADDAHGTAIMLRAEANGVSAETLIADIQHQHQRDFAGFSIDFDHYGSTHCSENQHLAESIYRKVSAAGAIAQRPIQQLFDQEKNLFLADRFVKGQCPKCQAIDQYGDSCEVCGSTYNATELGNPVSTLSGSTPVIRESEHYFFELPKFSEFLTQWTQTPNRLQSSIANKLREWLDSGLVDWDISRDAPYFGFAIPGTTDKYFYVWLDAPIGYMASFEQLCQTRSDLNFDDYWQADSQTELYHFIGKDIINFHGLFWPAMLHCAGYRTPTAIFAHGFLTVNGQKMSKSRGTFITAETYLEHLNPDYLRYYFASKLGQTVDDIDLNLDDFSQKVNSDLVGKLVNIASRCASFLDKYFARTLVQQLDGSAPLNQLIAAKNTLAELFEAREFSRATREIMQLADLVNEYIDLHKPWALAKDPNQLPQVHQICSMGILCYRLLILYLSPILPTLAQNSADFLGMETTRWDSYDRLYTGHTLNAFTPLLQRIENSKIEAIIAESASSMPATTPLIQITTNSAADTPMQQSIIGIEDFKKLDIRIGKIVDAQVVEGSDKLLALNVDIGEHTPRTILSGIREHYTPEQLVGQLTLVLVNLAPRKMRFGTSNGMVLAAGNANGIYLIHPDSGAQPGDLVS